MPIGSIWLMRADAPRRAVSFSKQFLQKERVKNMYAKLKRARLVCVSTALVVLGALFVAPSALAHSGEYAEFNQCPSTNPSVAACLYSKTTSGEVILGNKKVPIVNPVVLQGGLKEPGAGNYAEFVGATNGETLTKSPQPVPGGLTGLVNCKEISSWIVRIACEAALENHYTGVNSTVELAKPASAIKVNLGNILFGNSEAGVILPVKVHLENPFLGSECYIGSSSSPIMWNLATGKTSPPAPNKSISGNVGNVEFKGPDEGILRLAGNSLVDNSWSAPGATGCGGFGIELILDPIINASVGVPAAAGKNTAILTGNADESPSVVVNEH
jgi:hypothetical protein